MSDRNSSNDREELTKTVNLIVDTLVDKGQTYKDSWLKRGGVGASMMLLRKLDRVENIIETKNYDVFAALEEYFSSASVELEDDILDVAGYAVLILTEWRRRLKETELTPMDNPPSEKSSQMDLFD